MNKWKRDYDNLCTKCRKPLSTKARQGVGLDCWRKTEDCPIHGLLGYVSWGWEKGQLLIHCSACQEEDGDNGVRVLWDRNAKEVIRE
ncbi:hypothetical protein [endosymbiont GvMRE of Glomus versiforme]|uniref:hypothetical protein n=1 Tax=endosymbiont GvMRE of Glomus versiforme TaxID=2039283 RepID=UPI000EC5556C|nr:hypothetical protein [endosymbiont GvMRE of Glomus versiforme]RHZ37744.1 hypothetical protein GvMRE_I1g539 [endosymbiont GvMRE of Glomus versiforme]